MRNMKRGGRRRPSVAEQEFERRQRRPTEAEVYAEFKRRKRIVDLEEGLIVRLFWRRLRITWSLIAFVIVFFAIVVVLGNRGWLDIVWELSLLGAIVAVTIIWILGFYTCPQCGEVPHTTWHWDGLSGGQEVDLNPQKCRWCGARLQ